MSMVLVVAACSSATVSPGTGLDADLFDAGALDAGADGAQALDAFAFDAVAADAYALDAGDAGADAPDASPSDAHPDPSDAGPGDGGPPDSGSLCVDPPACVPGSRECDTWSVEIVCQEIAPCVFGRRLQACGPGRACGVGVLPDGSQRCARPDEYACLDALTPDGVRLWPGGTVCSADNTRVYRGVENDMDACVDLETVVCAGGDTCGSIGAGGAHGCLCRDTCSRAGDVQCGADFESLVVCADSDADGCLELEPTPCPVGQTCLLAAVPTCSSTCRSDCGRLGFAGCYGGNRAGECGNFDSDSCRDLRISPCPTERSFCSTTAGCVECLGGIDCAPRIATCVTGVCTAAPGRCFRGVGSEAVIPAGVSMGNVSVFLGLSGTSIPISTTIYLTPPTGPRASINTFGLYESLGSGYGDSVYVVVGAAEAPSLAALSSVSPVGTWTILMLPSLPPSALDTWAVCIE